jgi:LysM repeat protein
MGLDKMILQAYSDGEFKTAVGEPYSVFLNPESIVHNSTTTFNQAGPLASPATQPRYKGTGQDQLSFTLLLDGTRPIDGKVVEVNTTLKKLRSLLYAYHGTIHSPYYVQVSWGTLVFNGRVTTFNISYSLFRPDGSPVRAKLSLAFTGYIDPKLQALKADRQSSDLTHYYVVQAGDTLPQLCYRIYGSAQYYIQVAQRNNLTSLAELTPGTRLRFPPLRAQKVS